MLKALALACVLAAIAGGAAFWWLTRPERLDEQQLAALSNGNAQAGRRIFFAGGCSSCHADPRAKGDDRFLLGGGAQLDTAFGTFVVPNISQHVEDGIGRWSVADLAHAMLKGVSPRGSHYYPSFPYSSYARMRLEDIADLHAFLKTLPAVEGKAPSHRLAFPWSFRRGIGLWKWMHLDPSPVIALDEQDERLRLGAYLVEGPGHCGECHTPRDATGGLIKEQWLAGAKAAEGEGTVPNITSGEGGIGSWSESDIVYFFESGFTPDFDSVGGAMAPVQRNLAELRPEDREAIAAYLKALPPLPSAARN